MDYQKIVQLAEEATKGVHDPELKKIAFQEILRSQLAHGSGKDHTGAGASSRELGKHSTQVERSKPSTGKGKGKGKNKRAVGAREVVQKLDISPDEGGLPTWSSLSQDWKKFLWMLEAARAKGVDGLTSPEISHLIETVFRESYKPKQVGNLKKKMKVGFVRSVKIELGGRSVAGWKILSGGSAALKGASNNGDTK